jgi:hypothetical protein
MGYIELATRGLSYTPSLFLARDEFDQTAGALAGKVAPIGGTWSGAGDADDFAVETTGKTAQRTATSDSAADNGRFARLGTGTSAAVVVQTDFNWSDPASGPSLYSGALARYTDTSNYVRAVVYGYIFEGVAVQGIAVMREVAGAQLVLANVNPITSIASSAWYTIQVAVVANGQFFVWHGPKGALPGAPVLSGSAAELATGGALASGGYGIYDALTTGGAVTRLYNDVRVWVPDVDAAMFASQSLELRHDRATRENAGGTLSNTVLSRRGSYLTVAPAGREARSTRFVVKGYRNDPTTSADPAIDDTSAQLFVTPRGIMVPE